MDQQQQHLKVDMDQALKERIGEVFIREGSLFGTVPQVAITTDELMQLARAGWIRRDYQDAPVMEPPQSTVDWLALQQRHRDRALHAISHRMEHGAPWIGTRQEILEELLASNWEKQEDELRTLLHAFAFASLWNQDEDSGNAIESRETFFFYTERMQNTARQASAYATEAPGPDDDFWEMVSSLSEVRD